MHTTTLRVKEGTKLAFSHQLVPGVSPPVLDNVPYLNLDCCLIFFIRKKAYEIKILQIFLADIQFHETVLNFAWFSFCSLYVDTFKLGMKQGLGAQTKAQRQGGFPDSCKVSQCSLLNGISQGGFFFPLPGQQVSKIQSQLHNSPPPPLSIANPGRIGGGFSQSKWNLSKGLFPSTRSITIQNAC